MNIPPEDKTIICVDCGATFVITAGEQSYFISKLLSIPKRCSECRAKRKAEFNQRKMAEGYNNGQ